MGHSLLTPGLTQRSDSVRGKIIHTESSVTPETFDLRVQRLTQALNACNAKTKQMRERNIRISKINYNGPVKY